MEWNALLSGHRLGSKKKWESPPRSRFQRDFDRIVFSSNFRRLHGKTQVFPLPASDAVHTRLTHSMEAACVARSLGAIAATRLKSKEVPPGECSEVLASCSAGT